MSSEKLVTNEQLVKKFTSPFNLVTYATAMAHDVSRRGEEHSNLANYVLEQILAGEDHLEEGIEKDEGESLGKQEEGK